MTMKGFYVVHITNRFSLDPENKMYLILFNADQFMI